MKKYQDLSKEELIKLLENIDKSNGLFWNQEIESEKSFVVKNVIEKSIENSSKENMIIEGDNLYSLSYLKKDFESKIKLFIVDPPYNTGNEMIYKDARKEDKNKIKNSAWLNFLHPRLEKMYDLGTDNSVYAFFIDDTNVDYLKLLCDQIFGISNFMGRIVWRCRPGSGITDTFFSVNHEYVLLYAKNIKKVQLRGEDKDLSKYKNPDDDPRGPWAKDCLSANKPGGDVYYEITDPATGNKFLPPKGRHWPYNRISMQKRIDEGRVIFPKLASGTPALKRFKNELKSNTKPLSSWEDRFLTQHGSKALKELFNGDKVFDYPKPVELIKLLIRQVCVDGDIVCDPFAGSGTTGHALLEINSEQPQTTFILCTSNENEICEKVTLPRVLKIMDKFKIKIKLTYKKVILGE